MVCDLTQFYTIAWLSKSYIYYFFFIGSSIPVPATNTWIIYYKHSGFGHH
ncbi:hypothetical protein HETIRDRAFT_421979 [Heterobasidion irregulare TC 32-1]|uniref:Uncharacterized protein n=1 Tax=Heterobasidion irregulare (strain TC 32-1) TaxID=747525 RepID=W4JSJ6_HETIT|nr:uncharacterized protein HETIRDRAFT_421979 [Heterobasidion irregulare TC 32-1]ETW76537.1 hypothetical protein HETIRDRAFT_421979 [Heterobasidion irregulare TC 32-1]